MKEKTAVEWLTEKLRIEFGFVFSNNILDEAKEIEHQHCLDFVDFIEVNGFIRLKESEEYSNGEVHRTISEIYTMYLDSKK